MLKPKAVHLNFKFFTLQAKLKLVYALLFNKIAAIPIDRVTK